MAPVKLHLFTSSPLSSLLLVLWLTTVVSHAATQRSIDVRTDDDDTSWHKYVRAPPTKNVSPVLWVPEYTSGNITNPEGIVGNGTTTLTRSDASEDVPSIVLDFGQNYAGNLNINFAGAEASIGGSLNTTSLPGITLAFSETLEFLTNRSDFTRSDNQDAGAKYTNGTDQIAVQKQPYTWTNQLGCQFPQEKKVCSDGFSTLR